MRLACHIMRAPPCSSATNQPWTEQQPFSHVYVYVVHRAERWLRQRARKYVSVGKYVIDVSGGAMPPPCQPLYIRHSCGVYVSRQSVVSCLRLLSHHEGTPCSFAANQQGVRAAIFPQQYILAACCIYNCIQRERRACFAREHKNPALTDRLTQCVTHSVCNSEF